MKELVFGEGLMAPSLDGSKRFTVRKYRAGAHDFVKGDIVKGIFKDGLTILIQITESTLKDEFRSLSRPQEDAEKNGYYFDEDYFLDLRGFYPDLAWTDVGAVIFFEVLKVDGEPVVAMNEYAQ